MTGRAQTSAGNRQPGAAGPRSSPKPPGRSVLLWVLAILLTLVAIVYQRMIGPTRPARGKVTVGAEQISYRLARTHGGPEDHRVSIAVPAAITGGHILFRRYGTSDPWSRVMMRRENGDLVAALPHQPPAGKLIYQVFLSHGDEEVALPPEKPTVIRFRGGVPTLVLLPHVILMFLAMLWSNRAGFEALRARSDPRRLAIRAFLLLVLGGLIFGPLVQWYSFGEFWTGFPLGYDLTDNKTLIAAIAWIAALVAGRRSPGRARGWVLAAAIVTLIIYSIPHSVLGTELDYAQLPAQD
jgi:hypothetical protein